MKTRLVTLTETAQLAYGPKVGANWIYIRALGNDCYIGGADVTDTNGLKITTNDTLSLFVEKGEKIWGISKSGVHSLVVLEPESA